MDDSRIATIAVSDFETAFFFCRGTRMPFSSKYQALRQRFFDKFYFQGRVAQSIDNGVQEGKVTFADQTVYMGQTLMALASEMAVLRNAGGQSDAGTRIKEILDAFEELDAKAEKYIDPQAAEEINGFFVRDDISGPNDPRLGGKFHEVESDWQNPQVENASPSGDQIFGMMYGLLCVVRFSEDNTLTQQAIENSARLYDYARRCNFVLKLPNGHENRRGSDMRWLASLSHGLNKAITGMDLFNQSKIEVGPLKLPLNVIAAFWDDDNTAKTIADLTGKKITIPYLGKDIELNAFALHILLMALAPSEIWDQGELEKVALKANHHLSVLLYCQLHGKKPQGFDQAAVQAILDACPTGGPKASLNAQTGWQSDNRWVRCTHIYDPKGGTEEYNGIDYLALENLFRLVYAV
jgi:hypothetical protein